LKRYADYFRGEIPMRRYLLVFIIILPSLVIAQPQEKDDIWASFRFLEGKWIEEKPGVSKVAQVYEFMFNGKYLKMRTRAVFEPTEKMPKGDVHEDLGIFSYDQARKSFVFRQFHIEGFVIEYVLEKRDEKTNELTFISEMIENAPPGTKAKEVFKFINKDEFEQSFHVAWPDQDYVCFALNKLRRAK
jgi:hypothetical protein